LYDSIKISGIYLYMSNIQSILFPVITWRPSDARKWLKRHGYKYGKIDTTQKYHRFRQKQPSKSNKYRIFKLPNSAGIEFILSYPR
jgi:hypothetical protein